MEYHPRSIEKKWQQYWKQNNTYLVTNQSTKPKYYILDMFPYPSGAGLHVGHPLGYIASDIVARFKRLQGYNVLHPMGYDAFGLPAEQYAIDTGIHPVDSTATNIARYREQLDNIGFSFDWSREVQTSDPSYYKWTQWIFLALFEHYYDKTADKALPINHLIQEFEKNGSNGINAAHSFEGDFSAEQWKAMSAKEKDDILMNYRLAYRKVGFVNWCEALGTVLANDEVKDGFSVRGGFPVTKKAMLQWSLRTTAYAERLLNGLDNLDWSEALKAMQRNWIGRSEGAKLFFEIVGNTERVEIFTTRIDTIFGATFMVLAPEHNIVSNITTSEQKEKIESYLQYVASRSERERQAEVKKVTGEFTGAYALNPFTKKHIPIWIGEYVLKDYGTGAIMAVPSDDERDMAFAKTFDLPIIDVVDKTDYPGATLHDKLGKIINSDFLNGMEVPDAIELMLQKIESTGIGYRQVNYKVRDANYSRQRYWGEPFPIKYNKDGVAIALPISELPLTLPPTEDFKPSPDGRAPLSKLTDWVNQYEGYELETDTMPGFAGSSWYFLRYMDAHNTQQFASPDALKYWESVDFYIGGAEHAVGHLFYARMWHKFLFDTGLVPTDEPFKKLINQGMIQGVSSIMYKIKTENTFVSAGLRNQYEDLSEINVDVSLVVDYVLDIEQFKLWRPMYADAKFILEDGKYICGAVVEKMSKSKYNVINPDDVIETYGADCFRMYEMFLGPIEQSKPWDTKGISGVAGFLRKLWSLFYHHETNKYLVTDDAPTPEELKILHAAIKKVTEDIERFSLNTCVSTLMICVNDLKKVNGSKKALLEPLVVLTAPFAPHIAEELWHILGNQNTVCDATFPTFNSAYLVSDTMTYPICTNGKKRIVMDFPADASNEEIEQIVMALPKMTEWMEGKSPKKVIIVKGRMVNVVG
ncbi:MAG: leucine--tRNA ligase [Saprospiraceae bacterium]|nr:leucine--tRNA ligase [Saprospiraceae bacterium]MBP7699300.1 leucine--tRNA ligase [Saprospiraceae bacterium]